MPKPQWDPYRNAAGRRIPRVSEVINQLDKPQLVRWAVGQTLDAVDAELLACADADDARDRVRMIRRAPPHEMRRRAKADAGTHAHALIHETLGGPLAPDLADHNVHSQARTVCTSVLSWLASSPYKVAEVELRLISEQWQVGGTADLILRHKITGDFFVADLKTGNSVQDTMVLQLGAYAAIDAEVNGRRYGGGIILHCPINNGQLSVIDVPPGALFAASVAFGSLVVVHSSRKQWQIAKPEQQEGW
jgi:hypothetical protein